MIQVVILLSFNQKFGICGPHACISSTPQVQMTIALLFSTEIENDRGTFASRRCVGRAAAGRGKLVFSLALFQRWRRLRLLIFGFYQTNGLPVNLPVKKFLPEQYGKKIVCLKQSFGHSGGSNYTSSYTDITRGKILRRPISPEQAYLTKIIQAICLI